MKTMSHAVSIELEDNRGTVTGYCDPTFESVLEAFVTNFHDREEQGASVCINVEGETVVDLWGGHRHPKQDDDWQADTLTVVHSVTKAAVALCAHVLIAEGRLDPHAPVIDYWPEFGQAGKSGVTFSMLLNHSAGLAALRQPLKPGAYLDWDYMVAALAAETPFWEPGTRNGYHMSTFGWTVGEVVRRVSGQSLGEFFRDRIAGPLQLDFHIGLPDEEHHRVSRVLRWTPKKDDPVSPFTHALLADRE
ncbi:MAG: serine hydrolase, partial [Proteobacteria bacterium]|nr:serine hydrolase [Pseudomonadota bacterium]